MKNAITIKHQVRPYGHCATICPHQTGILLAYYKGPECTNAQRVVVEYYQKAEQKICGITLPIKTGNCVLLPITPDKALLIYSYFEDTNGKEAPKSAVERWRFCSNWSITLEYTDNGIITTEPKRFGPRVGYLTRCAPIRIKNSWILPMYREHDCYGLIMRSETGLDRWCYVGRIGAEITASNGRFGSGILIQPTLWYDNKYLHSLSRDISEHKKAWYSYSSNLGKTWTFPQSTTVTNYNNSIVAIQDQKSLNPLGPWLVWNDGSGRQKIVLGKWKQSTKTAEPIVKLGERGGSYPNYCFDYEDNLHIVHTDMPYIAHHVINREMLEYLGSLSNTHNQYSSLNIDNWQKPIVSHEDDDGVPLS
jgi:hypothetical protein